jgi:hypothetical protein
VKPKIIAVILVSLGIVAFLVSWNKLVDAFNAIGQLPESGRETYLAIVGQGIFYFILSSTTSVFGLLLLFRVGEQKLKIVRMTFVVLVAIWFILEIPIYECDFYEVNHSLWESKRGHFH